MVAMRKWIYIAGASGLISFGLPRILVGAGIPLDAWFITMGQALGAAANWIDPEMALWVITLFLGLLLFGFESWKHPVQRFWYWIAQKLRRGNGTDSLIILARIPQMNCQFDDMHERFCYKNQCNTIITTGQTRVTRWVNPESLICGSISTVA